MEQIINSYYANNAKKLRKLVDKVLIDLKFHDVDKDDFYSLANEVFTTVLRDYNSDKSFEGFLYSSLYKKFCTEMTRRTRDKRCIKIFVKEIENGEEKIKTKIIIDERLDAPIKDEEGFTLGEVYPYKDTVESIVFKEDKDEWRKEIKEYLDGLSPLQRKIAFLLSDNNTPDEICEELHITMKHFENSIKRILADERIRPLRRLI